ncbi:hypothetical protein DFH28DRAFT_1162182 [Melampsora americana]|nr:hypothetical protein DFH28DRAFT_1162182 [Melampsora americana]
MHTRKRDYAANPRSPPVRKRRTRKKEPLRETNNKDLTSHFFPTLSLLPPLPPSPDLQTLPDPLEAKLYNPELPKAYTSDNSTLPPLPVSPEPHTHNTSTVLPLNTNTTHTPPDNDTFIPSHTHTSSDSVSQTISENISDLAAGISRINLDPNLTHQLHKLKRLSPPL